MQPKENPYFKSIATFVQKKEIICLKHDHILHLAKQHCERVVEVNSIEDISWSDILFRKKYIISIPQKKIITNTSDKLKRKAIRLLGLSIEETFQTLCLNDLFFSNHGTHVIFVPWHHAAEIYKHHLSNFKVVELPPDLRAKVVNNFVSKIYKSNKLPEDKTEGTTVFTNPTNSTIIEIYKQIHPNHNIILRYHDRINGGINNRTTTKEIRDLIQSLLHKKTISSAESYYIQDARELNITYRPNGANPVFIRSLDVPYRTQLLSFIGGPIKHGDKSRIASLALLQKKLISSYPQILNWISYKVVDISSPDWLPYKEFTKRYAKSEIYIDLCRSGQEEGFSFRIPEALFLNRKIISNRKILKLEPFYSKNRVFIIGEDPLDQLLNFLECDLPPLPNSILRLYDTTLWWTLQDPYNTDEKKSLARTLN